MHSCLSAGISQIVLAAAGMDARAFRINWPPQTRLYELDRPEVLSTKEAIVARTEVRATCERRTIGVGLRQPSWPQALLDAGYEARKPSAWLVEGLLFYMTAATVHILLESVSEVAAPHSLLGADLMSRALLVSLVMWPLLTAFARRGVVGRFSTNDPEALFAGHGWEARVTQPGEQGANYERWPYRVTPREVPGIPRMFLVRAQRV
jgi:methyltransferase (TIGR00027 family)